MRQLVRVPHGAQHKRILEGEKKRGVRGPATRSAFWGCRACKTARDEAAKQAREARRRNGERRDWDDWKHEDSAPPKASLAHILSGSCENNIGWIGRMFKAWRVSHAERREEREAAGEDDDEEEDTPVVIPSSAVTTYPKGTPVPTPSIN